jgi:ATP-dependent DNA helicase RecG
LSNDLAPLSDDLAQLPDDLALISSNPLWQALPPELQKIVTSIGQRSAPDKIRDALIRLCHHKAWQASELGTLFGRNPAYLRAQYLNPLVNAGVLDYALPDQPNNPHQAYRAKGREESI